MPRVLSGTFFRWDAGTNSATRLMNLQVEKGISFGQIYYNYQPPPSEVEAGGSSFTTTASFKISFGSAMPQPAPVGTVILPSTIFSGGSNHWPKVSTPFLYYCHGPIFFVQDAKCSE